MTSQGHPYAVFRRALDSGNVTAALGAAGDLPQIGLTDALALCLLLLDKRPDRYETAALRWHGRYCRETRGVTFDEAQAVLALLGALRGPKRTAAAHALADLFDRRTLAQVSETLIGWASASRGAL